MIFFLGGDLSYIAGALCGTALHAREHASAATWCPGLFWKRTAQESRKTLVDNDGDAQRLKKRYVILNCFHTVLSRDRSAIQPRRKERSSAKCAAAGLCPDDQRRARPRITSCQRHTNALLEKNNKSCAKAQPFFFYSASDLHTLTLCLRGEVDPGRPYPLIIPLS